MARKVKSYLVANSFLATLFLESAVRYFGAEVDDVPDI